MLKLHGYESCYVHRRWNIMNTIISVEKIKNLTMICMNLHEKDKKLGLLLLS